MAITYIGHGFIGTTGGSSINVPRPTGLASGDIILGFACLPNGWTTTAPSGFTILGSRSSSGMTLSVWYKFAGGSEPSTYTWSTPSGSGVFCVNLSAYRGVKASDPFDNITSSTSTSTALTTGTLTTADGPDWIITVDGVYANSSSSTCSINSGTERDDAWQPSADNTYSRGIAVYDTNGTVPIGSYSYNLTRSSAAYHNSLTFGLTPDSVSGALSSTLPHATSSAAGQVVYPSGSFAATLPKVSQSWVGTAAPPSGILDTPLPRVTSSLNATHTGGSFTASLPHVQAAFAGKIVWGSFAGTLGHVNSAATGAVWPIGPIASTLPGLRVSFEIETRPHGQNVLAVEDERRAFRITQDDMEEIYRREIAFIFDGSYGPLKMTLPQFLVSLGGNTGSFSMMLPKLTSSFAAVKEPQAAMDARLPRMDQDFEVFTDPVRYASMEVTLGSVSCHAEAYNAVTWVSTGGFAESTGDLTVPLPTSYAFNDLLLLGLVADEGDTIPAPAGWTAAPPTPQVTASSATGNQLAVFWKVADGTEVPVFIADVGVWLGGVIHAFHGVDVVDGPFDVTGGIFQSPDGATATMPSLSTTTPNDMVVYFGGHGFATADPEAVLAASDADLTNVTERSNDSTVDGGGIYVWTANCPPAVYVDPATFTLTDPSARTGIAVALLSSTSDNSSLINGGPIVATLGHVTMAFSEEPHADISSTLPHPLVSSFAGQQTFSGSFASTLPKAISAFTGGNDDLVKYATSIGDGTNTAYTVTHSFSTRDVIVRVYDNSTFEEAQPVIVHTSTSAVTVTFAVAPTTNQYRVVVLTAP